MKGKSVAIVLLLMAASFGLGRWRDRTVTASPAVSGKAILYYHDPMHPEYRSDRPGKAPDCGMDLVPVYDTRDAQSVAEQAAPGGMRIDARRQQLAGVKTGMAEASGGTTALHTSGRIVPDESRVYRLTPKVDGWVRKIFPNATGTLVRKGQPLVAVYSKDFQVAQRAYIFALNQLERFRNGDEPDSLERLKVAASEALLNLENLGVSPDQIALLERTKKLLPEVNLVSPADGFIVARSVYPDQRFDRGADFYRIVDLSRVWIQADLSHPLMRQIEPGSSARVSVPQLPTMTFQARADAVLPQFDTSSRTLQLRLAADNPDFLLRPDMYVDLEFSIRIPPGVTVPRDAVVDSGRSSIVYVDRGGEFEARTVRTGWRLGDRVEVVEGLASGEPIVVSGTFLVDSESRMRAVARSHPAM